MRDDACCRGFRGNANCDPADIISVGDIGAIVDHKFITGAPLQCYEEADANASSGGNTSGPTDITVSDIGAIVEMLFISGTPVEVCP